MANKNFVVHNGLTVGLLTIDATTGDITTPGNLKLSGNGTVTVTNVSVSSMSLGDTSISIYDPGTGGNIRIIVDGTVEQTISAAGISTVGLASSGVVTASGVVYANSATDTTSTSTGAVIVPTGGISVAGNAYVGKNLYVGGSTAFTTALTTPTVVAVDNGSAYAQMAQINTALTGSADFIAYPGDYPGPSSDHGWIDMGFTGTGFNDPNYTITKPQDGYLFASGANTSVGGNLVLATDSTGLFNDIVIGVGSFNASSEVARFHGNVSNNGNLRLEYTTPSTSTTSGALQISGGAGVAGNINVGGQITIAGAIAATLADATALAIALGG